MSEPKRRPERRLGLMLGATGLVCALVIVSVYELTAAPIARHSAERLRAAVGEVLPGSARIESYERTESGGFRRLSELGSGEGVVHAGYDDAGRLVGLAIAASGHGYQDAITLLYGYDPSRERIVGLVVLASRETPGLGERIRSDARFLASFRDLDAALDANGERLTHAIAVAGRGKRRQPWEVDGITGATISSRAVARIVDASISAWAPALKAGLAAFRE